jgi:tetratricopeptide (TPR) repeat protein
LTLLFTGYPCHSSAQQPAAAPPAISTLPGPDPLAVGESALQHGDYAGAKTFFTKYLANSPNDLQARLDLGGADVGLKDFPAAIKEFHTVIAAKPDDWAAHQNLALSFALSKDWPDFDKERATLKAARDNNAPGLDKTRFDLIDVLQIGPRTYRVLAFYTLAGRYDTRYAFVHFGDNGKLTDYIQCESDDADQYFFKQKHPDLAAAGQRSFSLDTYSVGENGLSQGLIKFYPDGEPTYETVREDALKVLQAQATAPATAPSPK